jgi:2'-5' RNA ligase
VTRAEAFRTGLLVPVPEAESLVGEFRATHTPDAGRGTPAHITLLFPFLAVAALSGGIVTELRSRFARVPSFDFVLARTARFMEVVYLEPEPAEPFRDLVRMLSKEWPEYPPYEGLVTDVLPHLTVAYSSDRQVLDRIDDEVQPGLPLECRASEVWLMADSPKGWALHTRFALGG